MLFSSYTFFIFLPGTLIAVALASRVSHKAVLVTLIAASFIFYGWLRPSYALILIGSAAVNFRLAMILERNGSRAVFLMGIAFNVLLLAVFKYADFVIGNVNGLFSTDWKLLHIALPLALSFITFEQISFLSDVRTRKVPRGRFLEYLAFISFFPKLIAGPIIRFRELRPQLLGWKSFSAEHLFTGLCLFCLGLFKKVVIADSLAHVVDPTLLQLGGGSLVGRIDAVAALLAYSLQIYFDFSAYSEMALGIAWMFGIQLPVNFNSPYKAASLIDFWRRWHITLSSFLRDYVYIPLGGNRNGRWKTYANLLIVMLIGGIWHGAAWTFVAWGAIHGVALVVAHWLRNVPMAQRIKRLFIGRALSWSIGMLIVLFAWIMFRSPDFSTALRWLSSIVFDSGVRSVSDIPQRWLVVSMCLWTFLLPNLPDIFRIQTDRDAVDWAAPAGIPPVPLWVPAVAALALVASITFLARDQNHAFIYFQF